MLIKFGDYNINYKYIYLAIIFNFLSFYVNDGNLNLLFFPNNQTEDSDNNKNSRPDDLYVHPMAIDNLNFLGVIIISFILHKIREKKSGIYEQDDENIIKENSSEIKLISFLNFFIFFIFFNQYQS